MIPEKELEFKSFVAYQLSIVQLFLRSDPDGIMMATGLDATPAIEAVEKIFNKIWSER